MKSLLPMLCGILIMSASWTIAQDIGKNPDKVITGKITSITVHNLKATANLTKGERSCSIQIRIDTDPNLLLGISYTGTDNPVGIEFELFDILKEAFKSDWPVTIRWRKAATYSEIVSVQVNQTMPKQAAKSSSSK